MSLWNPLWETEPIKQHVVSVSISVTILNEFMQSGDCNTHFAFKCDMSRYLCLHQPHVPSDTCKLKQVLISEDTGSRECRHVMKLMSTCPGKFVS
jgi:hypothetical protein